MPNGSARMTWTRTCQLRELSLSPFGGEREKPRVQFVLHQSAPTVNHCNRNDPNRFVCFHSELLSRTI